MDAFVHTGRWTDWSKGSALGDQITLSSNRTNVLIAFIAIFITFVGSIAWSIIAFAIHQSIVSESPSDGFHHQLQAMLANNYTPSFFAYKVLQSGWAWRKLRKSRLGVSPFIRACAMAFVALLLCFLFVAAGVLLSLIAQSGQVLLRSPYCGVFASNPPPGTTPETIYQVELALNAKSFQEVYQAYEYAQACYPKWNLSTNTLGAIGNVGAEASAADCAIYTKTALNWTTTYGVPCPFKKNVCRGPTSDVVQIDTGYLDSNDDLGINSRIEDRLLFRRVQTCAPLVTQGYSTDQFENEEGFGSVATYNYGVNYLQPDLAPWRIEGTNYTFVYPYSSFNSNTSQLGYELLIASNDGINSTSDAGVTFYPDPEVFYEQSQTTLLFLANRVNYPTPINDPWFNASIIHASPDPYALGADSYYSELPGSILGCSEDIYICNPMLKTNSCMKWNEVYKWWFDGAAYTLDALQLNSNQRWVLQRVGGALVDSTFVSLVDGLGAGMLAASQYLGGADGFISYTIPDNQWVAELQNFMSISMATIQRTPFRQAVGDTQPLLAAFVDHPENMTWICNAQKFRSNAYSSFSVVGLGLIFGIGGFILLIGLFILFLLPRWREHGGNSSGHQRQWFANELLNLQRIVFEDRGLGHWKGTLNDMDDSIPLTESYEAFLPYLYAPTLNSQDSIAAVPETEKLQRIPDPTEIFKNKSYVHSLNSSGGSA